MNTDSPLSVSSNIIGILTFLVAVAAAAYARIRYLRNCHTEYLRVKKALLWFKTESEWLERLLQPRMAGHKGPDPHGTETHMCRFVMDDLVALEQRLLDLIDRIESAAVSTSATATVDEEGDTSWAMMAQSLVSGPSVTMAWLSSRTEMLELVRQREALTGRVQFLQLSMLSARLTELEAKLSWPQNEVDEVYLKKLGAYDRR